MHAAIVVLSVATAVYAQSSSLSAACTTAATGLLTGSAASCLDTAGLTEIIAGSANSSIVPAVQSYVSTFCGQAPCSSSVISTAQSSIQSGCATDISNGQPIALLLNAIFSDFPDSRGLICSEYISNSTYCLPTLLSNIQTATGQQITVDSLEGLFSASAAESFISNLPSSAVCNACGHAIITEVSRIVGTSSSSGASTVKSAAASKCGSSFEDGQIPSSISTGTTSASSGSSSSSSAAGLAVVKGAPVAMLAGVALAAIGGAITLLA